MKSITIVSEDRIGLLSDITYILGKARINIEGVDVSVVGGKAIVNITIKDSDKARNALTMNGYEVMENNVLIFKLEDKPGQLAEITKKLSNEGVCVNNVYIISKENNETVLAMMVDKYKKSEEIMKDYLVNTED